MFIVIDNWKPLVTAPTYIEREWLITVEREDFTEEENKALSLWAILNNDWTIEVTKTLLLNEYKELEEEAMKERLKFLTLDMLDDWVFKLNKQTESDLKWVDIKNRFNTKITELVGLYWESILDEL